MLFSSQSKAEEEGLSTDDLRHEREVVSERIKRLSEWIPSEQEHGRIGFYGQPRDSQWIVVDLGASLVPEEIVFFPARLPVDSGGDGSHGFPSEVEVEIAEEHTFSNAVRLGRWEESFAGGAVSPPMLRFRNAPLGQVSGRFLRTRIFGSRPRESGRGRFYTLGEIVVMVAGRNAALGRPVTTSGGIENAPRWQAENLTDGYLWCLPGRGVEPAMWNGFHSEIEEEPGRPKWVEIELQEELAVDEVHLVPAHPRDFADTSGFGFPSRFRVVGIDNANRETVLWDLGIEPFPNPGASTVMISGGGRTLRRVRVECSELWQRTGDYIFALSELQVWSRGKNVAAKVPVTVSDALETGIWRVDALTDGDSSRWELLSWKDWLGSLEERIAMEQRLLEIDRVLAAKAMGLRRSILVSAGILASMVVTGLVLLLIWQRRRAQLSHEALRERIAHDLHDELGASLSHIALESDLARRHLEVDHSTRARLTGISESARYTLDHMRDVIWLLAPSTNSWIGFQTRIESIVERMLGNLEYTFATAGELPLGRPSVAWSREWVLFLKEALTNARCHAKASKIEVELHWKPGSLRLLVQDNGQGFDPEDPALSSGLGLRTFRRRAAALGGAYEIKANVNEGVTVEMTAPIPKHSYTTSNQI